MKTIYYTASSLDGFIATPDDSVAWLDALPQPTEDTYAPFITNVGAICMGRSTYEFLLRHMDGGGAWAYPDHPVWVFTHREFPQRDGVTFTDAPVAEIHRDMATSGKDIWICGGGDLAGQFLDAGLLDEIVITVGSQTLGAGKPLLPRAAPLELLGARALGAGFAELRYRPRQA